MSASSHLCLVCVEVDAGQGLGCANACDLTAVYCHINLLLSGGVRASNNTAPNTRSSSGSKRGAAVLLPSHEEEEEEMPLPSNEEMLQGVKCVLGVDGCLKPLLHGLIMLMHVCATCTTCRCACTLKRDQDIDPDLSCCYCRGYPHP
jgi:hypothetical protein